jgi:hypothetical protein
MTIKLEELDPLQGETSVKAEEVFFEMADNLFQELEQEYQKEFFC